MSNNKNSVSANSGVGFSALLQLVFIILKLCGVIDWKWVWVLSPLWIGTGLCVIILGVVFCLALADVRKEKRWQKHD